MQLKLASLFVVVALVASAAPIPVLAPASGHGLHSLPPAHRHKH